MFYKNFTLIVVLFAMLLLSGCGNTTTTSDSSNANQTNKVAEQPKVKTYDAGQYKVGKDLPGGEYILIASGQMSYVEVAKDSTGAMDSIICNDAFQNRSYITVSDGEYLKIQGCKMYSAKDAPKVEAKDGFYISGMYKVGTDIPAGEYKVIADKAAVPSYIEVASDSRHSMDSIISNDAFQGDKYITVSDGQYLKLQSAKIKAN